jgi:hypothetical protein
MPGFDRTGPGGQGPRTGRGQGHCGKPGREVPASNTDYGVPYNEYGSSPQGEFGGGRGFGRGWGFGQRGNGAGPGRGRGGGRGRGRGGR